ncbi:hypothetical protein ANO11243_080920 [Dothideomycetidae sp. 11243]|nr:hypothetical protein ANO11243_080920 [fungal sp. No.11243]
MVGSYLGVGKGGPTSASSQRATLILRGTRRQPRHLSFPTLSHLRLRTGQTTNSNTPLTPQQSKGDNGQGSTAAAAVATAPPALGMPGVSRAQSAVRHRDDRDGLRTHWPAPKRRKTTAAAATSHTRPEPTQATDPAPPQPQPQPTPAPPPSSAPAASGKAPEPDTPSTTITALTTASTISNEDRPDHLARTCLFRFFQHGVISTTWHIFEANDSFRLAYIGSPVSNLAHLVQLRLTHRTPGAESWTEQRPRSDSQVSLHYPYPQIRSSSTWRSDLRSIWSQDPRSTSSSTDDELSEFPIQEVREALINAYFDHIHPTFPVVAKSHFLGPHDQTHKPPPPLLYQAVLLAGAHVCSHPLVSRDRWMVKAMLFSRASMLFHLRRETDRLYLTQAALLFTWHINDGDTVAGGPWYWAGIAVRLGYGQGTHRNNALLPVLERVMHKRTWWCAVVLEVFSALEYGRPCSIQWSAIDQSLPTDEDLCWGESAMDGVEEQSWDPKFSSLSKYHVGMIRLARIGMDIIELNFPGGSGSPNVAGIDNRLASWSMQNGIAANQHGPSDFLSRQLALHYNLLILYLHRSYTTVSEGSRRACSVAADAIINTLDQLSAHDEIGRCHAIIVSAVTAVSIHLVYEIRSALETDACLATVGLLDRLSQTLGYTKQLLPLWPNAEAVYNVFEGLRREYEQCVSLHVCEEVAPTIPESLTDWSDLFSSNIISHPEQLNGQQPWLDLVSWTELQ